MAEKALKEVGTYWATVQARQRARRAPTVVRTAAKPRAPRIGKLGRFQVMALLQAVRYFVLTGEEDKAKSFGLNRAIFYAWAKRRGVARPPRRRRVPPEEEVTRERQEGRALVYIGNEGAYASEDGWFIIGNTSQLPQDYDRQILSKIEPVVPYEQAWSSALEYVKGFPRSNVLNQNKFFSEVYKPVRDKFVEEVVERRGKLI